MSNRLRSIKTIQQSWLLKTWQGILNKRTIIGFRLGEAITWFLFHASLAFMLGGIFYVSGIFESKDFMTLRTFAFVQMYVLSIKAIYILPFWWLFFNVLRKKPMAFKLLLHILTAGCYVAMAVATVYLIKTRLERSDYPRGAWSTDIYGALVNYFFHFTIFHAYNFWLEGRKHDKREHELKELAYQSEIVALKAQIAPHFLFNTLNSISASVPPPLEKTRVLIAQLADTFRYALRVTELQLVCLQEELAFIKTWLSLEHQRFSSRLQVSYEIDKEAPFVLVPPMILQPIIENAIKHGIAPLAEGGRICITCKLKKDYLFVSVSDTGQGFAGSKEQAFEKGVGLRNIERRLSRLYNESIDITSGMQTFTVSFFIPIEKYEKGNHYRR